ncbi:hypothetical protein HanIR_Chr16g0799051 [Helianthus annuus]|nr:hypothetical protein HanIR_Chr16g0799051 [Helianthus annuus]
MYLATCNFTCTPLFHNKPTSYNTSSPLHLVFGQEPNISHLMFLFMQYALLMIHHNVHRWDLKGDKEIHVGYEKLSIVEYFESLKMDLFTTQLIDIHFYGSTFPT